jgi:pimeloyl-ACP methyl ester carboxylesterase
VPAAFCAAVLTAVLTAVLVAGCGDGDAPAAVAPSPPSTADDAPEPAARCGFEPSGDVQKVVVTAADGVELAAARFGGGSRGVVLVHQLGSDLCGWAPQALRWAGAGYQVLAFDQRCDGLSECGAADFVADVAAAVADLRRSGAAKVVVVGASRGASIALVAAARADTGADGVVSLSAHTDDFEAAAAEPSTPAEAAAAIRAPLLFACAELDSSAFCGERGRAFVDRVPAAEKNVVELPGVSTHGWDLLPTVAADVDGFLRTHTG